jgi:hypothetical protein
MKKVKEKKLGVEWLDYLSKENQILFCKNRVNFGRFMYSSSSSYANLTIAEYLGSEFYSIHDFINHAFEWVKTPEGHDYWSILAFQKYDVV